MRHSFPRWTNRFIPLLVLGTMAAAVYVSTMVFAATLPSTLNVGYEPTQPLPFSHKLHVGRLRLDCRYCHNTVDKAAHAAIPPTATCINCHAGADSNGNVALSAVRSDSLKLEQVRRSQATGDPIAWVKVHDLPDYVYFDHSAHVNRGVGCISCHGRVDKMDEVKQVKTLSMTFCLDCHRNPNPHLRPLDKVTDLAWVPEGSAETLGAEIRRQLGIEPRTNCSTCHR